MLDISFGLQEEAKAVTNAVAETLKAGWRTGDIANSSTESSKISIANSSTESSKILGTQEMGEKVLEFIK